MFSIGLIEPNAIYGDHTILGLDRVSARSNHPLHDQNVGSSDHNQVPSGRRNMPIGPAIHQGRDRRGPECPPSTSTGFETHEIQKSTLIKTRQCSSQRVRPRAQGKPARAKAANSESRISGKTHGTPTKERALDASRTSKSDSNSYAADAVARSRTEGKGRPNQRQFLRDAYPISTDQTRERGLKERRLEVAF